jgi:nucleoside-diphosphate-sugar epimerase
VNILCLGGSYTGRYLASKFSKEHQVAFLSRNPRELREQGYTIGEPQELQKLSPKGVDVVLDTVPAVHGEGGLEHPYRRELEGVLTGYPKAAFIHLSSTSVYPMEFSAENEIDLPTMDETSPASPDTERGAERLLLEQHVARLVPDVRILRCGGIYGPERCMAVRFKQGDFRRVESGNRMVSRIHVHDLARLILAAGTLGRKSGPKVVNAVDDRSSTNREAFGFLEELLGVRVPGDWREARPQGRRVVSLHVRDLLWSGLTYSTYREGFTQCLAATEV